MLRYTPKNISIKNKIDKLISNFKKPIDEKDLKVIILGGLVPETEKMLKYIKDWN